MEELMRRMGRWLIWLLVPLIMGLVSVAAILVLAPEVLGYVLRYALAGVCVLLALWAICLMVKCLLLCLRE